MTRFRVTYAYVDTFEAEIELDADDGTIGDFIAAAYEQGVLLPSIDAEIQDVLDWTPLPA